MKEYTEEKPGQVLQRPSEDWQWDHYPALHHRGRKLWSKGEEAIYMPHIRMAKKSVIVSKMQFPHKETGWDLSAALMALRDKKLQTVLED